MLCLIRHCLTSACQRDFSLVRISSNIFFVSGVALQDRIRAFMEQKHGLHTQHGLLAFALFTIELRGIGGPQSKSQMMSGSVAFMLWPPCCVHATCDFGMVRSGTSSERVPESSLSQASTMTTACELALEMVWEDIGFEWMEQLRVTQEFKQVT
jgi:hypothetical protein